MTRRTLIASLVILLAVAGVIGALAAAVNRQHEAASRAQRSLAVIAAANLTEQRLLAVQTNIRGYLIGGNEDLLSEYRIARAALPDATYDLQALVAGDRPQERRAEAIRAAALSYVDDYGDMVIGRTREDGVAAGRAFAAANDGGPRAEELDTLIASVSETEQQRSAALSAQADAWSDRALLIAFVGMLVLVLVLGAASWFMARRVAQPVVRLAAASDLVRRGDFSVQVPAHGRSEVGRLGASFNAMARALEESRDELESQNAELESQASLLEERQEELIAQRDEISATVALLAEEKRRAELHSSFADLLAGARSSAMLGEIALEVLADAAGADVGVLYMESWRDASRWPRSAVLGLDPAGSSEWTVAGGEGATARAVGRREPVLVPRGGLRVQGMAGELAVDWELHVPLSIGARAIGVAVLGGVSQGYDASESATVQRLASQAAVALAEAGAAAERNWLFQVNAAVLDGVREGIALVGLDHELVFANAAMSGLAARLGISVDVAIGAHVEAEVDTETYFADWEAMLADSDEPIADEVVLSGVSLERFTAPVDDAAGARIGRLVVLRDVTRERDAERLKSDLMATVSHELRTPLASVLGYAELLRTRRLEPSARDEIVGTVHREAKRLSGLIDDFLDLQSIEQERFVLALEPFVVDELLAESVATFRGQSARHTLSLSLSSEPVRASGDRSRIAQVVANLLSNAIKYSPSGGEVAVVASNSAGFVRVSVQDSGLGIPAEAQSRIFEKFFRVARPESRVGGTGLGLALAHEIVVAHGGEMGFSSVEGEGSTFWFTLPAAS